MKTKSLFSFALLVSSAMVVAWPSTAAAAEKTNYPSFGKVDRLDPAFDKLVPLEAKLEKLAEGFVWSEGPVWIRDGGYLVFSDVPKNTVFKWKEGEGISEFLKPSGYTGSTPRGGEPGSNGLTVDSRGRLVLCQHGDRRVARLEKNRSQTTLVDNYLGKRLNSPNDLTYKSNGDLYFTDPPYGLEQANKDPKKELPYNGVYRLSKNGKLTLLTKDLTYPNGITFSPDEKTLYVAVSDPKLAIWMAYDVQRDGTIANGRVFFNATGQVKEGNGLPDGLKSDKKGNLFATGPGGVFVFSPAGKHLGTIDTGQPTGNCAWGDDGSTLYIMANHYLSRIKTRTVGKGF